MTTSKTVTIIGGGVIGLATAHYLMKQGADVRIIEKNRIGDGASHGNCGLLYFTDLIPLCAPGAVSREILRMLCGTSPLYIKPEPDIKRLAWLLRFAANCRSSSMHRAVRDKYDFLAYSFDLFKTLLESGDVQCDFEKKGLLSVFRHRKNLDAYQSNTDLLREFGIDYKCLDRDETLALEPALLPEIAGSWYSDTDQHLRPERLMDSWRNHLVNQGLLIHENCEVVDFDVRHRVVKRVFTRQGEFAGDAFVLAAGAWSSPAVERLGLELPMQPGKGYSITMDRPETCPEIPCLLYEKNMVVTPWKSGYRLGGTMEFSGYGTDLNPARLQKLIDGAKAYLRHPTGKTIVEKWTSLRPMTCDDMPIIDRLPRHENMVVATGHGMLGLTLATGTGKMVSDMIFERKTEIPTGPYALNRF